MVSTHAIIVITLSVSLQNLESRYKLSLIASFINSTNDHQRVTEVRAQSFLMSEPLTVSFAVHEIFCSAINLSARLRELATLRSALFITRLGQVMSKQVQSRSTHQSTSCETSDCREGDNDRVWGCLSNPFPDQCNCFEFQGRGSICTVLQSHAIEMN